jgi:hypothetical protein
MIITQGAWFRDEQNRILLLRGVNLGGSSKVPVRPDGATYKADGFFDDRTVSFVGRPFPLEEADEHFSRLQAWGVNFLRFLVTWEAVEHAGPGIYDEEYLDYLYQIVTKAGEHGLNLFIDPHMDVWSRFSGGDGAPGWTFDVLGMDIRAIHETGAAFVHQIHGDPFPRMIWITNNHKYAAATLYTLFFAGNDFAPACKVVGIPVQEYLQEHYINSMRQVVRKLNGLPNVIGYDTLNEPAAGYIGFADLTKNFAEIQIGPSPTPWQNFQAASGFPCKINVMTRQLAGTRKVGEEILNPNGISLFKAGAQCPWRQAGVWQVNENGQPELLKPDYFTRVNGHAVDFNRDYFKPFVSKFISAVRSIDPDSMIFIETVPNTHSPEYAAGELSNTAYAVHWYDDMVLVLKRFIPWLGYDTLTDTIAIGAAKIRKVFAGTLGMVKHEALTQMGGLPTIIGEVGIPFDLNDRKAYKNGDFSAQEKALHRDLTALDDNLLSYTLWNYTSDNTNAHGDLWNDEDLSIFSCDQQSDPADINSGGRGLRALLRPYPIKTAGTLLKIEFDMRSAHFVFEFESDPSINAPTELYLPSYQYPKGCQVTVSDGTYTIDSAAQRLYYKAGDQILHRIELKKT